MAVVVLGTAAVWLLVRDSGSTADDAASELDAPAPEVADATREFLAQDGQPLVDLLDFTGGLESRIGDAPPGEGCAELLEDRQAIAADQQMLELLREIPDPTLGRLWVEQLDAADRALQLCDTGLRSASVEAAALSDEWQEMLEQRLDELKVSR